MEEAKNKQQDLKEDIADSNMEKVAEANEDPALQTLLDAGVKCIEEKDFKQSLVIYTEMAEKYPNRIEGYHGIVRSHSQNFAKFSTSCVSPIEKALQFDHDNKRGKRYKHFLLNNNEVNVYGKGYIALIILATISLGLGIALTIVPKESWLKVMGAFIALFSVLGFASAVQEILIKKRLIKIINEVDSKESKKELQA